MQEKIAWLQRHDQECGGLYGVLPICVGLPIRATEHLDRQRGILKGCKGKIIGWSSAPATEIWNTLPTFLYVQFETIGTWHIDGMPQANLYPVTAVRKPWYLDRQRQAPQLRVTRQQFPVAPGFAVTAHIAQGQTLREGVIADFNIGDAGNPFTTYVAATRVTGRDKLLLLRPFPAGPFQKGIGIGRGLLLQVLRGDAVNWEALRAKYTEERLCCDCNESKNKNAFTVGQWKREDAARVCRECVSRHRAAGEPYQCSICQFWFPEDGFPPHQRHRQCSLYRVCLTCEIRKPCARCKQRKVAADFARSAWKTRAASRRICRACATKARGCWTCKACRQARPKEQFNVFARRRASGQNGTQVCDICLRDAILTRTAARTTHRLTRRRREVRKKEILDEVRREIALQVRGRPKQCEAPAAPAPKRARQTESSADATALPPRASSTGVQHADEPQPDKRLFEYQCPYCMRLVRTTVQNGNVFSRAHCGKQFRVRHGQLAKQYKHVCPPCGAEVLSSKAIGRVQIQHMMPNGEPCKTTQWHAAA